MRFRPWLEGAGLGLLYLLPLFAIFLAPGQDGFYHQVMPVTSLTRAALLDLILLALILGTLFIGLGRIKSSRLQGLLWLPVLFITALLMERGVAEFFRNVDTGLVFPSWMAHTPWILLAVAVALFLFADRYYTFAISAAEVFLSSAGIATIFLIVPRLVYVCFDHAPPEHAFFSHPATLPWQAGQPRIVWLLFDELSYGQIFDHRQAEINLPAFAQLQGESVSFSDLIPTGLRTQLVIPGLFSGQTASEMTSNHQGQLLLRSGAGENWHPFDPAATLFAAARRQGWGTGVVGWYNPYCRLLATTVDRCYWTFQEFAGGSRFNQLSSQRSTLENAIHALPLVPQVEIAFRKTNPPPTHEADYDRVLQQANLLIQDTNIRFAFVHLPVPHPPGIYPDPLAGGSKDYLGNLILADKALAELRAVSAKTPAAADTILVVSSDHSWRVHEWRPLPGWTNGEERASNNGQFDTRPVLMVHFPGQTQQSAQLIESPVTAMIVHSLLLDIFNGKITKAEDLNDVAVPETLSRGRVLIGKK
jgi:hypothetical protein